MLHYTMMTNDFYFSGNLKVDISCEWSARQTVNRKCQALFSQKKKKKEKKNVIFYNFEWHFGGGWVSRGVLYLASPGHPTDIGLQLGKACYLCSRLRVEGECYYFFCFFTFIPFLSSLLSHFFISSTISSISLPFSGS